MNTYSREEIRKTIMQYHNLDGNNQLVGIDGVRRIMGKIESIQYDPLNVVGRNVDLVLQARVNNYKASYLYSLLYKEHYLIDGFDKEMCIYNTYDFEHFTKVRKEHTVSVTNTLRYRNQKYFDITERIVKFSSKNIEEMSIDEFLEWYVDRRIRSLGMVWNKNGGAWQGHYLCDIELRNKVLHQLEEKGSVDVFQIEDMKDVFYSCKKFKINENNQKQNDYSRFIAPLDNIM